MLRNFVALVVAASCAAAIAATPISFGLFADTPYTQWERENLHKLIADMSEEPLEFVVHVGDIKSGASLCSDETYQEIFNAFQQSRHPLIYVPGDNEWTDCHHRKNADYDPIERLGKLRSVFFAEDTSLGQRTLRPVRQSGQAAYADYRENVRWEAGGVLFVTINLPGSGNNYFGTTWGSKTPQGPSAEFVDRSRANASWLAEAFSLARQKKLPGVMVLAHANPGIERWRTGSDEPYYREFLTLIRQETQAFDGEVVLVHGDTHYQHVDQPMVDAASGAVVKNFTRVENFGSPFFGWIKAVVDVSKPKVFSFTPKIYGADAVR